MKESKSAEDITKVLRVQKLELYDRQGRKMAVIDAEHGVPCVTVYNGRGKIRCWLTFMVDGKPDIRFFDLDKPAKRRKK